MYYQFAHCVCCTTYYNATITFVLFYAEFLERYNILVYHYFVIDNKLYGGIILEKQYKLEYTLGLIGSIIGIVVFVIALIVGLVLGALGCDEVHEPADLAVDSRIVQAILGMQIEKLLPNRFLPGEIAVQQFLQAREVEFP